MAKKRLTVKERTAQRTKKARDLFRNSLKTHFLVHTGHVTNEASWLYDVHRVGDCLLAALRGDDSHEETRITLDRKYKKLEKIRGSD